MGRTLRKHRVHVDIPVEYTHVASGARLTGRATDISIGGLRLETAGQLPFGSAVVVRLRLPGALQPFALEAIVRWNCPGTMGLQFGTLGVRETHFITELSLTGSPAPGAGDVAWVG
jgi:hypothetical protein